MEFGTLFGFLTTEIGCFSCKYGQFYIDTKGMSYKCKNRYAYRQYTCYESGNPRLFDMTKKDPNTGLYMCECDSCGVTFQAHSTINICQDCFLQAEYDSRSENDD